MPSPNLRIIGSEANLDGIQKLAARTLYEFPRKPPPVLAWIAGFTAFAIPTLILIGIATQ